MRRRGRSLVRRGRGEPAFGGESGGGHAEDARDRGRRPLPALQAGIMREAAAHPRHRFVRVRAGLVPGGGGAPIVVQSMTNTDAADVAATTAQVAALARAGSEIVRITVDRD